MVLVFFLNISWRDGRTGPNKLDYINYNLLSSYTV